jgi:hypothetical protein
MNRVPQPLLVVALMFLVASLHARPLANLTLEITGQGMAVRRPIPEGAFVEATPAAYPCSPKSMLLSSSAPTTRSAQRSTLAAFSPPDEP